MTEVRLTNYTPDPKGTVWRAARVCYSSEFPEEVPATQNEIDSLIRRLLTAGHMSPFEHASFTFDIEDVSRVTTHQIVRHRIASYSQKSQRYTKIDLNYPLDVIQPPSITPELEPIFDDVMGDILVAYRKLIRAGVPREDARYILPEGIMSDMVMTMNARELRHFFELRCCKRAQWEIREIATEMLRLVRDVAPLLFESAGPRCDACPDPCVER